METAAGTAKAGRKEWIGLGVIALPCALYSMDLTVLNLAVPSLSVDLKPTSVQLLWIVDIYGFMLAGSLMTMGTLGDRIGRRKLLLIGACAFGFGSVLAALSNSAAMLIATRALLGIAGATLAPSTLSLIRNMFHDSHQRTVAIGIWIASLSAGSFIGPLVGGVLLERFGWRSAFLAGVPVMALLLVAGPLLLPEFKDPKASAVDLISAVLSLGGVLSVIYGLKQIAQGGPAFRSVLSIVIGLAIAVLFVRRQRRLVDPLIDLRLFRAAAFSASLATYTLASLVAFGVFVYISQYLQFVLGLSPLHAGLWTMPLGAAFIIGSTLTPMIARRGRPADVIAGGLTLAAVGFAALTQIGGAHDLVVIEFGMVVFSLGLAPVFTVVNDVIVGTASPERAGVVSALSETGSEFGGAIGIAILGSLGTAVYRHAMANAIPRQLNPSAAAAARDTIGGALAVAERLSDPLRSEFVGAARSAFTQAMDWVLIASVATVLTTAIVAAVVLRRVGASAEPASRTKFDDEAA
jgi:DHA2 family multidrug resistance protein-like MFS transporter